MSAAESVDVDEPRLPIPGWCLLELRGTRVTLGGFVQEIVIGGAKFLELKVPDGEGGWQFSRFYNAVNNVASVIPTDEKRATDKALKQWHGAA